MALLPSAKLAAVLCLSVLLSASLAAAKERRWSANLRVTNTGFECSNTNPLRFGMENALLAELAKPAPAILSDQFKIDIDTCSCSGNKAQGTYVCDVSASVIITARVPDGKANYLGKVEKVRNTIKKVLKRFNARLRSIAPVVPVPV